MGISWWNIGDIAWRLESTTSWVKILDGHGACALIPGMRCWIVRWGTGATDYVCILAMTRKQNCLHEAWWVRFDGQDISIYFMIHDISLWQVGWHQRGPLGMFMINIDQLWSVSCQVRCSTCFQAWRQGLLLPLNGATFEPVKPGITHWYSLCLGYEASCWCLAGGIKRMGLLQSAATLLVLVSALSKGIQRGSKLHHLRVAICAFCPRHMPLDIPWSPWD